MLELRSDPSLEKAVDFAELSRCFNGNIRALESATDQLTRIPSVAVPNRYALTDGHLYSLYQNEINLGEALRTMHPATQSISEKTLLALEDYLFAQKLITERRYRVVVEEKAHRRRRTAGYILGRDLPKQ